jgi:hypothetical protein
MDRKNYYANMNETLCRHCKFDQKIRLYDSLLYNFKFESNETEVGDLRIVRPSDELSTQGVRCLANGIAIEMIQAIFRTEKALYNDKERS